MMKKYLAVLCLGFGLVSASAQAGDPAEANYKKICFSCHDNAVAGSPKLGDKEAWKDRITKGKEALYKNSINGFTGSTGVMPPRGGSTFSDDEIKAIVDYMVSKAGG